jgi:hypothetical protein
VSELSARCRTDESLVVRRAEVGLTNTTAGITADELMIVCVPALPVGGEPAEPALPAPLPAALPRFEK